MAARLVTSPSSENVVSLNRPELSLIFQLGPTQSLTHS